MPHETRWTFDPRTGRFHDTVRHRWLDALALGALRNVLLEQQQRAVVDLVEDLGDGESTIQVWEAGMQGLIKSVFGQAYVAGRGGLTAMNAPDWDRVEALVLDQYAYLHDFAGEVADGSLSLAQIEARARLYVGAAVQAFEHGRAQVFGAEPPHVPGDGSTPCLGRCRCLLIFERKGDVVEATWIAEDDTASCDVCIERSKTWSPLVLEGVAA